MARVNLEFIGNARSAVAAARETAASLDQLRGHARGADNDLGKMFRGATAGSGVFRGLGRSIAFASTGFLGAYGLSAAVRGAVGELENSIKVSAQTAAVLKSTGGVANVTARQVDQLATSLMRKSGTDDEAIKSGENMLLTFRQVRNEVGAGNDVFTQATRLSLDMSKAFGTDMTSAALQLGKALNDPITGMTALRRVGISFTESQREQIKALVDSGHTLEAQKIILAEVRREVGGSAEAYGKTLPGQLSILRESVRNLSADLLRSLTPSIESGIQSTQRFIDHLEQSGEAQRFAERTGRDLAQAVKDAAAVVRVAAKGFGLLSDAVGGDVKAFEVLGGAALTWKVTGAVNAVQGMLAVKKAAEAAAGAEVAAGAGATVGVAGLIARLRTLAALGPIAIEIDLLTVHRDVLTKHFGLIPKTGIGPLDSTLTFLGLQKKGTGDTTGAGVPGAAPQTGRRQKDERAAIVAVAQTQLGIPYQWGGPAILGQHTDCSGLAQAVLAKNGIHIPRTTYDQWRAGHAVMVPQPGDLVFFHMGPKGPEHVGIYIGNDQFIEDPHTGSSVRVSKLSTYPGYVGARSYVAADTGGATYHPPPDSTSTYAAPTVKTKLARLDTAVSRAKAITPNDVSDDLKALVQERDYLKQVIDHTKATKAEYDQLAQLNDEIDQITSGKTSKSKTVTGAGLLSDTVRKAIARASGTKDLGDDIAALKNARAYLEQLQKTASKKEQVPIAEELGRINKEINSLTTRKANAEIAKNQAAYKKLADEAKKQLAVAKAAWEKHVQDLKTAAEQAKQAFESVWSDAANTALSAFDKATQKQLAQMEALRGQLTPAEQQLAALQAAHEQQQRAAAISSAQSDLAKAQAAGDPDQIAQAQQALDAAMYDQQLADLQAQADQERAARDKQYQDQEQAYQDQRDLARGELQKWLDQQLAALESGAEQWQAFYSALKDMAAKGGWDVGSSFWQAWQQAQQTFGVASSAGAAASAASNANPAVVAGLQGDTAILTAYLAHVRTPGFASGGWATRPPTSMDPRDTILARLRPGEYVMSPEEVAAGRPRWAGGGGVTLSMSGATFVGAPTRQAADAWARHIADALERLGPGMAIPRG